jgi:hypothetical protein
VNSGQAIEPLNRPVLTVAYRLVPALSFPRLENSRNVEVPYESNVEPLNPSVDSGQAIELLNHLVLPVASSLAPHAYFTVLRRPIEII